MNQCIRCSQRALKLGTDGKVQQAKSLMAKVHQVYWKIGEYSYCPYHWKILQNFIKRDFLKIRKVFR